MNAFISQYGRMILTFVIWIAVFYFVLILPNKKKKKQQEELFNSLKEGIEVITVGGIKGTISGITPQFITLRIDKGVNIQVLKTAISRVIK